MVRIAPGLCLALLVPCCTTHRGSYPIGEPSYELARRTMPGNGLEVFRLETKVATGDAWLEIRRERDRERPFLGLKLMELDKAAAERRGVKPYSGLFVSGTHPESAAAQGGVLAGDVLLAIDGRETVYLHQVPEAEARLGSGQIANVRVLRGQVETELVLTTRMLKERVTTSDSVPLINPPPADRPYAGCNLRGIPAVWCEQIFGSARNATVITTVEVGSPAWLAGFRGGDLIEAVDQGPVPAVEELARMIVERGERKEKIALRVSRGGGNVHEASIALRDFSGMTEVSLPLVFSVENGVSEDRWSLLPFGMLASHTDRYVPDATREIRRESSFSCLFGLFHVNKSPLGSRLRLLWFITIDS